MVQKEIKTHSQRDLLWGRIAAAALFFVMGSATGSWLGRITDVRHNLGLNEGTLGFILLAGSVGGLIAMQGIPRLLKLFGHRALLCSIAPLYPLALLAIPAARTPLELALALALFGALGGSLGVVANTHATDVELAYERAIMSSFHAQFSIGSLCGALIAGFAAGHGVSITANLVGAAIILSTLTALALPRLLVVAHADPKAMEASVDQPAHHHHKSSWWRGVLLIGSLTFIAYLSEGAVADWSAIFMRDNRHAGAGLAVIAYVAFSACMAIGRLTGDTFTMRFGKINTVQRGAILAAGGLLLGVLAPVTILSVLGFAIVGCGLAVLVPVLFSIAGTLSGGESHAAIARVSTIAFFGLLVGPAIIGFIAHHVGLSTALLVPCGLLFVAGFVAPVMRRVTKPVLQPANNQQ